MFALTRLAYRPVVSRGSRCFSQIKLSKPNVEVKQTQMFINGKYCDAISGKTMATVDPRNESEICQVSEAQADDVDKAVGIARDAFVNGSWSKIGGFQRGYVLNKWADLIERDFDYFVSLETLDVGKPLSYSQVDMRFCVEYIRYFAGFADKIHGKTIPCNNVMGHYFAYTVHEPAGVIGSITPWNFPLLMFVWQAAPALACGNSLVAKISETTPLTALYNAQLMSEAGIPDGVVNVLPGFGPTAGRPLAKHPGVDKVTFTGSGATGKDILLSCAENLTPATLELGGKSPAIIFPDADIDNAVQTMQLALFFNAGQCCNAASRIFVHESIYDEFVEKTVAETAKRKVGDPFTDVDQGPQQNLRQFDKVKRLIQSGKDQGATVLHGGNVLCDSGYFVESTVFGDVSDDMDIAKEEIFGPVMQIFKFSDRDEVIRRANDTKYGLAAAVFSQNIDTCMTVSRQLKAGSVWMNAYHVFDASLPFGGYKQSGFGRVKSEYALDNFTKVKCIATPLKDVGGWY